MHGLKVLVKDIGVMLKCHDVVATRAAHMYGCTW